MTRHWQPCRVCGANHANPASSSICEPCGAAERMRREEEELARVNEFNRSPFGMFMAMPEHERWRLVFDMLMNNATEND